MPGGGSGSVSGRKARRAGEVRQAELVEKPGWAEGLGTPARGHGRKSQGIRFELDCVEVLEKRFPDRVNHGQWLRWRGARGADRWGQTDVLIPREDGRVIVVECKLTWKPEGIVQLKELYLPVLRVIWPEVEFVPVLMCGGLAKGAEDMPRVSLRELADVPPGDVRLLTWRKL